MKKEKMSKWGAILVCAIIFSISLYTIMDHTIGSYGRSTEGSIYNDNSKIVLKGDSYSYVTSLGNHKGGILKKKFRFTGMHTIYKLNTTTGGRIEVNYQVDIDSGKFKIVFINAKNQIIDVLEGEGTGTKGINLEPGVSRVKLVADDAKGELRFNITTKDKINIKYVGK